METKDIASLLTALVAVAGSVLAVTKYLSRRDKQLAAQQAFRAVVESLSSSIEYQRLGAAILLRRFLDPRTELGEGGTPYAREAVDVSAALLRETKTGNFQKLLADGLLYASSLESIDLQRANLQNAYLGSKRNKAPPNLKRADFYRADLSGASLRGADAEHAVFYQARLHNTVFNDATLIGASFFEADLLGSSFSGAKLQDADFSGARNVPPRLRTLIAEDGRYRGPETVPRTAPAALIKPIVFVSKPGTLTIAQQSVVKEIIGILSDESIAVATVERRDYPLVGAVAEVRRVLSGCTGAVIIGFRQLEVINGTWRRGTAEARSVADIAMTTPWSHVEAGMAAMAGLPMFFMLEHGVAGGLFDLDDPAQSLCLMDSSWSNYDETRASVQQWAHQVRQRAAR